MIADQFGHLLNAYAKAFNNRYNRRGRLFVESIHRERVDHDAYLRTLIRYIHLNPVKHGFATTPFDWTHSSIHAFQSASPTKLLRAEAFGLFESESDFWKFHSLETPFIAFEGEFLEI
jgi:putative transposase